jgi:hypothetical protein
MTRAVSPLALGYSILAGPILWFVHFIAVYTLAEFGCRANFTNLLFLVPSSIRLVIIAVTVPFIVAVGLGGVVAYRAWQTLNRDENALAAGDTSFRFLVTLGILFSALFVLGILFTVAPAFVVDVCDRAV